MEIFLNKQSMLVLLLFSLFVAWKVRKNKGIGILGFGYVSLVVFLIGFFTIIVTGFITITTIEKLDTFRNGEKCNIEVISYTSRDSVDSDGDDIVMYTPTYKVYLPNGNTYEIKRNYSSSSVPVVGDREVAYFDEESKNFVQLNASSFMMAGGMLVMWMVLAFAFIGIFMYAFDCNMNRYFTVLKAVGMAFFLPLVMIGFEAMLIFALFYGNDVPIFVSGILVFFILVLGLSIVGIIKMLITEGLPKWKRTGEGSWSADWSDDEDSEDRRLDVYEGRREKYVNGRKKRKKKMVPLNEKYLEDRKN